MMPEKIARITLHRRLCYLNKTTIKLETEWNNGELAMLYRNEIGALRRALFALGEAEDLIPPSPQFPQKYLELKKQKREKQEDNITDSFLSRYGD